MKKQIKNTESIVALQSGKEIHYKHPWGSAVEKVFEGNNGDKKAEKKVLIKIIDFRNKLKSIILPKDINNPDETLKICEYHIADVIKKNNGINSDTFLNDDCINTLINPQRKVS